MKNKQLQKDSRRMKGLASGVLGVVMATLISLTASAQPDEPGKAGEQAATSDAQESADSIYRSFFGRWGKGERLSATVLLRENVEDIDDEDMRWVLIQTLATSEAILGNTIEAIADLPESLAPRESDDFPPIPDTARPVLLTDVIRDIAASQQVIMINEAHHVSRHRATATSILKPLYESGFRYLAAEALANFGQPLASDGYPTVRDGSIYINDPMFGGLIREALRLGYTLVPYEDTGKSQGVDRETAQAKDLAAILEKDPKAKMLVYAGYSHINESGLLAKVPTMAQRFKELTGIDPFTISQTETSWPGPNVERPPVYAAALILADSDAPFVLHADSNPYTAIDPAVDMLVFTPPTHLTDGRPDWLARLPGRIRVTLPLPESDTPRPWLVEARKSSEKKIAIPIDRLEVKPGETAEGIVLWLLPGNYEIERSDVSGKVFHVDSVTPFVPPKRGSN